MPGFNLNLICEQVLFENTLSLIAENAEKLINIRDFAGAAGDETVEAKQIAAANRTEIDRTGLKKLRDELKLLFQTQLGLGGSDAEIEAKLDDYIENVVRDPSSVKGLQGEPLSPDLNLRGLKYLHRRWFAGSNF